MTIESVIIDAGREAPNRKQYLYELGIPIEEKRLEVGDYLLGTFCIEYKTWSDFYASMLDGRLWQQLINMKQYDHPMIAVVGDKYKSLFQMAQYRRGQPEKTILSGLVTIYKSFSTPILMFDNDKDFCEFVAALFKSLNSDKVSHRPVFHRRRSKRINDVKEDVISEARGGVSVGKAKMMLKENDYSIKKLVNNLDKLENIKGIGPSIIKRMKEVFE